MQAPGRWLRSALRADSVATALRPEMRVRIKTTAVIGSVYLACWLLMSWPLPLSFTSQYWMDEGDGLVMVWNLWHAARHPFELLDTNCGMFPDGFCPLLHSYHPLTSWMTGFLPLPLIVRFNLAIVWCFVSAGVFTYWLCRWLGASKWGAFVGGFAFTFTGFHWAHAEGHMNLISTQCIPLFVLAYLWMMQRPDWPRSLVAAAVLFAALLTDHYFATYCALLALLLCATQRRNPVRFWRFAVVSYLTSGVLALALLQRFQWAGISGGHWPRAAPLDPLALFVPGAHWRFAWLTKPVWSHFPSNIHENSVYLGLALWVALLWRPHRSGWWVVLIVFAVLAMGERPSVLGHEFPLPLPYAGLTHLFPPLALGGVPVRLSIVAALAAAILGSLAFTRLGKLGWLLFVVLFLELLPDARPAHAPNLPPWTHALQNHSGSGALLDPISEHTHGLYYQTEHHRKVFHAMTARFLPATHLRDLQLLQLYRARDLRTLRELGFGYLRVPAEISGLELIDESDGVRLYYLGQPGSP